MKKKTYDAIALFNLYNLCFYYNLQKIEFHLNFLKTDTNTFFSKTDHVYSTLSGFICRYLIHMFVAFLRRLYYSVTHHQCCPFGLLWGRYAYWDPITLVVQYLVCSEPYWTTTSCPVSLTGQLVFQWARQLKC